MTFADSAALGRWLRKRAENVAVALLSTMFACFIIQIFFRYVLNNPVGWTEEVIVTTWLWSVLWGAALRSAFRYPLFEHYGECPAHLHGTDRRRVGFHLRNLPARVI